MPDLSTATSRDDRPRLLLLDTCGSEASVALAVGPNVIEEVTFPGRSASERLIEVIDRLLRAHAWQLRDLSALTVTRGPGSFTGVRVGLAAAKALAEASALPLVAVSRLAVLAARIFHDGLSVLEAGRGELFWARVHHGVTSDQGVASRSWVAQHACDLGLPILCEAGCDEDLAAADVQQVAPLTASAGLSLALDRLALHAFDDPLLLDALYLHKTEQETLDRQRRHQQGIAAGPDQA